jgi:Tfp pilus assembly protein PilO
MPQFDPERRLIAMGWCLHGLGALAALCIVLSAHALLFQPIDRATAVCDCQTQKLQRFLRNERRVCQEHRQLSTELKDARRRAAELAERVPHQPQEAEFLAQVSQLAEQVGLLIRDYRPGAVTRERSYSSLHVELIGEGSYGATCHFLDRLSRLPRHSTVVFLQMSPQESSPKYDVRMSLELYFAAAKAPSQDRKG